MKESGGVLKALCTGVLVMFWALSANYSLADKAEAAASSGFLAANVEAELKETRLDSGRHVSRYVSPDMGGKKYTAVMVDRAIYYPAPNPGPEVSSSVLDAVAQHLTDTLKKDLSKQASVVDAAGPAVLRLQPAFTSVTVSRKGLSGADIIPVHLLFSAARSASGKSDYATKAFMEARLTDSVSGNLVAAVKMELKGKTIDKGTALTLADLQDTLDKAAADGAHSIAAALN